ncbi:MAG: N-acetylmuramoyl-L-alanine amidase [Pseudomonadota bacterium]
MVRRKPFLWSLILAGVFATTPASAVYKICIDPGHGGADPGAVGCGLEEAPTCLDVAWRLHDLMATDPDLTPIMTRTSDVAVSLAGRVAYANDNGAHRFASIHNNAFNGSATGIETFCYANGSAVSFDQRNRIQDGMTSIWPDLTDRGGKTANFYVIKYTDMPATLSELAFIDNCAIDATYLSDPSERQAAAAAHHQAIRLSLGLDGTSPGPTPDPDPEPNPGGTGVMRGVIFEDLGVGSDDMSVRIPGVLVEASGGGTNGSDVAAAPDADWLMALAPGTYTIAASAAGYYENSRVCAVTAGQTTWCSVGLFSVDEDPPLDPPIPSDGPTGTLLGTVFEEQGQGTADMSLRLPGASVKAMGTAGTVLVVTDGEWGLYDMALPPGTYEVTAALAGYWPNVRLCSVAANTETWCSLGLWPEDQQVPDDPTPGYGDGPSGGDIGDDVPEGPPTGEPGDGLPQPGVPGSGWEVSEDDIGGGADGGCAVTSSGTGAGLLLLLFLVVAGLLLARRRKVSVVVVGAALLVTSAALAGEGDGLRIVEVRAVTDAGGYEQPLWSPDGSRLAFAGDRFSKLLVASVEGGPARPLADGASVGYEPVWSPDGAALEHRQEGQRSCAVPVSSVTLDGTRGAAPAHRHPGRWVRVRDDQIHLKRGPTERRISPPGDRYCCATMTTEGGAVAFMGLATGIHVHDVATGRTVALGAGAHPRFSADGARLVFDRCVDDGDAVTGCTLRMVELAGATPVSIDLPGAHPMARHPALSPDGTHIAYDAGGRIWVGRLDPKQAKMP